MAKPKSLQAVFKISPAQARDYKLHAAVMDTEELNAKEPYYALVALGKTWENWNDNAPKNDYNRQYIFSMVRKLGTKDKWLFGGIFLVVRHKGKKSLTKRIKNGTTRPIKRHKYDVTLTNKHQHLIRRAEIKFVKQNPRGIRFNLDNQYTNVRVVKIHKTKQ